MNKNNNLGRFILVLVIIAWALIEINPPTSRDLVQEFARRAQNQDANFKDILAKAAALQKQGTNEYQALQIAAGTNDLAARYFNFPTAKNELNPNNYVLNRLQRDAEGQIKLGIDLQGGTSFLLEMDTSKLGVVETKTNALGNVETVTNNADISGALSQAIDVLRRRVDKFGVAEPIIQSAGGNRILVQLPGLSESARQNAVQTLSSPAFLEFRMVNDGSDGILHNGDPIPPGYESKKYSEQDSKGQNRIIEVIVKKTAENGLAGDIVRGANVIKDNMGNPEIAFELTDDGAKRFGQTTKEYSPDKDTGAKHRMAIILDGTLYCAPEINGPIEGGSGTIEGQFTYEEASRLANVLQNPLRAPLTIVYASDVGATMGADTIHSGISASFYGVLFVSLFMLVYYRLAGIAANIALITNVIILLGVMCSIGTTFTMPGIAGGVLTVGMAVDANVLIYERLREELAKGKSLRGAIDAGYARAFGTIFDSHVTTLISSIILIIMGTGEIKGFGVTLTIGVAASLFTALVVTRLIFNFLTDRNLIKSLSMTQFVGSTNINFMKVATPLAVITTVFAIASMCIGGAVQGRNLFGIDFRGGDSTTFTFAQHYDLSKVREALPGSEKDAQIQYQTSGALQTLNITSQPGTSAKVVAQLQAQLPEAQYKVVRTQQVGATIGTEIVQSAVIACLLAMFGILVYVAFRYEFYFAIAAVAAVLHDVLFAIGAYCLASILTGRQFNATVVAALLTIIGFSINDKIVIFDRIREDLKLGMRGSFKEIINVALNQTLSRTIITSGTVLIATLCLFIWGGPGSINDFALTFIVGVIVGTYSSIYIASTIVLKLHKGERPTIGGTGSQVTIQNAPQASARAAKV